MIIMKSTEQAMRLIREMEGESHLVQDEPYLPEEDRVHRGIINVYGAGSRYVIHPVSKEIGICLGHSSIKAIKKKWSDADGRNRDTICDETTRESASTHEDIKGSNRAHAADASFHGTAPYPVLGQTRGVKNSLLEGKGEGGTN